MGYKINNDKLNHIPAVMPGYFRVYDMLRNILQMFRPVIFLTYGGFLKGVAQVTIFFNTSHMV